MIDIHKRLVQSCARCTAVDIMSTAATFCMLSAALLCDSTVQRNSQLQEQLLSMLHHQTCIAAERSDHLSRQ